LLVGLALVACSILPACNGCGKKAPVRTFDAAGSIESRAMRRMAADRTTAKVVSLDDLVTSNVDPAGSTPAEDGELVRLKGSVLEVKETYVLFQDGTYAATCELPPAEASKLTKGDLIELTGFYNRGGGHIAARITGCEIATRADPPKRSL
jgi:hypothetical protein